MKIQELILLTNNLSETKKFYEHTIGFQKITETKTSISFAVGTSKLIFELTEENQNPKYHICRNIGRIVLIPSPQIFHLLHLRPS